MSFNARVDTTNILLETACSSLPHSRAAVWRCKGFWSPEAKASVFANDGVHLIHRGQQRLYQNLRGAVVSAFNTDLHDFES